MASHAVFIIKSGIGSGLHYSPPTPRNKSNSQLGITNTAGQSKLQLVSAWLRVALKT